MTNDVSTFEKAGKEITSSLEKIVDGKFLVLLLSFFLYLDIWLLRFSVDPTIISFNTVFKVSKNIPIFEIVIFFLSYSLLMAGFFPVLRKIIGILRLRLQSTVPISNSTIDERRLSDWSLAFVSFSLYDLIYGFFISSSSYNGLAVFILNILQSNELDIVIFRLSVVCLWFVCLAIAVEVDDDY